MRLLCIRIISKCRGLIQTSVVLECRPDDRKAKLVNNQSPAKRRVTSRSLSIDESPDDFPTTSKPSETRFLAPLAAAFNRGGSAIPRHSRTRARNESAAKSGRTWRVVDEAREDALNLGRRGPRRPRVGRVERQAATSGSATLRPVGLVDRDYALEHGGSNATHEIQRVPHPPACTAYAVTCRVHVFVLCTH